MDPKPAEDTSVMIVGAAEAPAVLGSQLAPIALDNSNQGVPAAQEAPTPVVAEGAAESNVKSAPASEQPNVPAPADAAPSATPKDAPVSRPATQTSPKPEDSKEAGDAAAADEEEEEDDDDSEAAVPSFRDSDRFKTWRKHVKDLYQTVYHLETHWPSRACQPLPFMSMRNDTANIATNAVTTQTLVGGTQTGGQEQNYLQFVQLVMPTGPRSLEGAEFDPDFGEIGGFESAPKDAGVRVERRLFHEGDVLGVKYMPVNPRIVATTSSDGNVYLFDPSQHSLMAPPNNPARPLVPQNPVIPDEAMTAQQRTLLHNKKKEYKKAVELQDKWDKQRGTGQQELTLTGNEGPAFSLDWNTQRDAVLIAGSSGRVCAWRPASHARDAGKTVEPFKTYTLSPTADGNADPVNDVKFDWRQPDVFYVTTESGALLKGDLREPDADLKVCFKADAPLFAVATSPLDPKALACGDGAGRIHVFDSSNFAAAPLTIQAHQSDAYVSSLEFCPHASNLILSGGSDGNCPIYDLKAAATEGSDGLVFKHAGHVDTVSDVHWCWQTEHSGLVFSSDDNAVMAWKPRNKFW